MTARDFVVSVEDDSLTFGKVDASGKVSDRGKLGERMVYLYMRYHADKKGILRMPLTEIAHRLETSRRTIMDHVESLLAKKLVTREGHGRYRVHAEPWSLRTFAKQMLDALQEGEIFDTSKLATMAYGESLDWASEDPRVEEVLEYAQRLERAGLIWSDEYTGETKKGRRKAS